MSTGAEDETSSYLQVMTRPQPIRLGENNPVNISLSFHTVPNCDGPGQSILASETDYGTIYLNENP
mgnify:CR=1 FL=1